MQFNDLLLLLLLTHTLTLSSKSCCRCCFDINSSGALRLPFTYIGSTNDTYNSTVVFGFPIQIELLIPETLNGVHSDFGSIELLMADIMREIEAADEGSGESRVWKSEGGSKKESSE